jgi:glutamate dehydrogenase/leucine dehydrogenase
MSVRMETRHVSGLPVPWGGLGDTSILTGLTVYLGMRAAAEVVWGSPSLAGRRIMVQGAGKVAAHLMQHLAVEGAELLVSDVSERAAAAARERFGAAVVAPDGVYDVPCDVFSPNAVGGVLNERTIPRLQARVICGGANNQLSDDSDAVLLHARGILYAPDFMVNCGGVISAECEILGAPVERAEAVAARVADTARRVFDLASRENTSPSIAAERIAVARIEAVRGVHRTFVPVGR